MCFSSKPTVPKPSTEQKAPDPVLLDPPKGLSVGDGADDANAASSKGISSLKVEKVAASSGGDGSQTATATDTGATSKVQPKSAGGSINRALKGQRKEPAK